MRGALAPRQKARSSEGVQRSLAHVGALTPRYRPHTAQHPPAAAVRAAAPRGEASSAPRPLSAVTVPAAPLAVADKHSDLIMTAARLRLQGKYVDAKSAFNSNSQRGFMGKEDLRRLLVRIGLTPDTSTIRHAAGEEVRCVNGLAVRPATSLREQQTMLRLQQDLQTDHGTAPGWVAEVLLPTALHPTGYKFPQPYTLRGKSFVY